MAQVANVCRKRWACTRGTPAVRPRRRGSCLSPFGRSRHSATDILVRTWTAAALPARRFHLPPALAPIAMSCGLNGSTHHRVERVEAAREHKGGVPMVRTALTAEEQAEIWRRYRTGQSLRSISRTPGPSLDVVRRLIAATGGARAQIGEAQISDLSDRPTAPRGTSRQPPGAPNTSA